MANDIVDSEGVEVLDSQASGVRWRGQPGAFCEFVAALRARKRSRDRPPDHLAQPDVRILNALSCCCVNFFEQQRLVLGLLLGFTPCFVEGSDKTYYSLR